MFFLEMHLNASPGDAFKWRPECTVHNSIPDRMGIRKSRGRDLNAILREHVAQIPRSRRRFAVATTERNCDDAHDADNIPTSFLFVGACAYRQDIHYNHAPGTNFAVYKTYQWVDIPGGEAPDQFQAKRNESIIGTSSPANHVVPPGKNWEVLFLEPTGSGKTRIQVAQSPRRRQVEAGRGGKK